MVEIMAMGPVDKKGMEKEAGGDVMMVKQMVNMMTVPRCMEEEVEKFMQGDTVIFMPRLHRMGRCEAMVNVETKLRLVATRQMLEEEVVYVMNVMMVKQMVEMVTVPRCIEGEVVRFVQGDTVIFVTRLHSMGQCKAKVNRETMLMMVATR